MEASEKLETCKFVAPNKIEVYDGCPCKKKKKLVSKCLKRNILGLEEKHCQNCDLYESNNEIATQT